MRGDVQNPPSIVKPKIPTYENTNNSPRNKHAKRFQGNAWRHNGTRRIQSLPQFEPRRTDAACRVSPSNSRPRVRARQYYSLLGSSISKLYCIRSWDLIEFLTWRLFQFAPHANPVGYPVGTQCLRPAGCWCACVHDDDMHSLPSH